MITAPPLAGESRTAPAVRANQRGWTGVLSPQRRSAAQAATKEFRAKNAKVAKFNRNKVFFAPFAAFARQ
jgi:hypothetical protein